MSRKQMIGTGIIGGGVAGWQAVTAPVGFTAITPPFTIQQNGRSFRIDPTFSLQTYAETQGITVAKTYYLDITGGLDANSGLDKAHALQTMAAVYAKGDADRIVVAKGYYHRSQSGAGTTPGRSMEIIGDLTWGTGDGVYITGDCKNQITSWTLVNNHYEGTSTRGIVHAWDGKTPDSNGQHVILTQAADAATVESTPGTWVKVSNTVYVRTTDSRAPDADLHFYETANPCMMTADNRTLYVQDINYRGGWNTCSIKNSSATGGTKFYAKSCDFGYGHRPANAYDIVDIQGATAILQVCTAHGSPDGDAYNYKALNTVVPLIIEIDCTGEYCGDTTIDQGSTMHDGGSIIRIGGEYHHTKGQCIADAGAGQMWNLGVSMHDAESTGANKDGYDLTSGGTAWLDSCTISVAHNDINTDATVYYRNLVSGGVFSGTATPY